MLADAALRAELAKRYPAMWQRVQSRRAFMQSALGLSLDRVGEQLKQALFEPARRLLAQKIVKRDPLRRRKMRQIVLAERDRKTVGEVISTLARQGLARAVQSPKAERNGIPLLPSRHDAAPVTPELVQQLRDELP